MRASAPVASVMRFAALPVVAANAQACPAPPKILSTAFNIVVLPVPGPPVSTHTRSVTASRTASSCSSVKPNLSLWRSICTSSASSSSGGGAFASSASFAAQAYSAAYALAGNTTVKSSAYRLMTTRFFRHSFSSARRTAPRSTPSFSATCGSSRSRITYILPPASTLFSTFSMPCSSRMGASCARPCTSAILSAMPKSTPRTCSINKYGFSRIIAAAPPPSASSTTLAWCAVKPRPINSA